MVTKINICSHTVHGCSHSDAVQVVRTNTVQQGQKAVCLGLGVTCGDYLPAVNGPTVCGDGGDLAKHGGWRVVETVAGLGLVSTRAGRWLTVASKGGRSCSGSYLVASNLQPIGPSCHHFVPLVLLASRTDSER